VLRKGLSSEKIAKRLLENLGYTVVERRKQIVVNGAKVAEVDLVAIGPDGEKYAVEVKAGKISVNDIRQAYTNALLVEAKPMIVCKGYADEGAKQAAKSLGVEVITFSSYYLLLDIDELYAVVNEAVREVLEEYGLLPLPSRDLLSPRDIEVLEAIAKSSSMEEAADRLGIKLRALNSRIKRLKLAGVLPRVRDYDRLKLVSKNILRRVTVEELEDRLRSSLKRLERVLDELEVYLAHVRESDKLRNNSAEKGVGESSEC